MYDINDVIYNINPAESEVDVKLMFNTTADVN